MADDTMEICPVRYGDEDFDFDFDLTAPPEDEDSILEDVNSIELSITLHNKINPTGNDFVMNDNDDSTFEMDDIETLIGDEKKENEPDSMSLTTGNDLNLDRVLPNHQELDDDQLYQESSILNQFESHTNQINETQVAERDLWDDEEPLAEGTNKDSPHEPVLSPQESQTRHSMSPKNTSVEIKPPEDLLTSTLEVSKNSSKIDGSTRSHSSSPKSSSDTQGAWFNSETNCNKIELNDVIILYQSNEYALFSASELDDPDSFFFKDLSISQKPLSDFFGAIRDVVHEDLGDEDELLISIPELGLQTEETSLSTRDVTLSQVIGLRKQLLLNDGIETPQPLCIELGTRKSFMRELSRITLCANEGKGLSNIALWGDNYENLKTSNVHKDGSRSPSEQRFRERGADNEESEVNYTGLSTEYSCEAYSSDGEQEEESDEKVPEFTKEDEKRTSDVSCHSIVRESSISRSSCKSEPFETFRSKYPISLDSVTGKRDVLSNGCFDEESDIIDYSEDDTEEKTQLAPQIKRVENEYINDSNWDSDRTINKSSTSCADDGLKTAESNASSAKHLHSTSTLANKSKDLDQNPSMVSGDLNTDNPINSRDETPDINDVSNEYQENGFEEYYESLSGSSSHAEALNHAYQVNELGDSRIELNATSDRNNQRNQKSPINPANDTPTDDPEEDYLNRETGYFLEDEGTYQSNNSKDSRPTPEDVFTTKGSEIERYTRNSHESTSEKTLIETKQMSSELFSIDVPGAESEDEIGYDDDDDDDDDEESSTNPEENPLNLETIQPGFNYIPSINGKRSRLENNVENLDFREIKRPRS